jgi:hypothetical protein
MIVSVPPASSRKGIRGQSTNLLPDPSPKRIDFFQGLRIADFHHVRVPLGAGTDVDRTHVQKFLSSGAASGLVDQDRNGLAQTREGDFQVEAEAALNRPPRDPIEASGSPAGVRLDPMQIDRL